MQHKLNDQGTTIKHQTVKCNPYYMKQSLDERLNNYARPVQELTVYGTNPRQCKPVDNQMFTLIETIAE
jgi:hypothetical protein